MINKLPQELLEKELITQDQFARIEPLTSGKIVSVFYELRILLYLGIMLFTTGMGILIYENIGDLGHLVAIVALIGLTTACYWFVLQRSVAYSNGIVKHPVPYSD